MAIYIEIDDTRTDDAYLKFVETMSKAFMSRHIAMIEKEPMNMYIHFKDVLKADELALEDHVVEADDIVLDLPFNRFVASCCGGKLENNMYVYLFNIRDEVVHMSEEETDS